MAILDTAIDIQNEELVKRSDLVAFMGVESQSSGTVYARMKGFTENSTSKNPKEYSRQYVDEDFERTSTTGFNTSISYAFDKYKGNPVLEKLAHISDMELLGKDATVELLMVDMTSISQSSGSNYTASAFRRKFTVSPSSSGDSLDCMTYSGEFKACGDIETVTVSGPSINPKKWLQCTVSETAAASDTE